MAIFPGAEASFAGFTSSHTLSADNHAAQHNSEQAEITATQHKLGTGASTPTSGMLLRGNGIGTSVWGQAVLTTDVTGILPIANGGNGTTSTTGTGSAVFDTSPTLATPTLTTPVIASFASANHNHQNSAGGGALAAAALPALSLATQTLSNPYKFFVYRNAAQNISANAYSVLLCDTKVFDTSSNVDLVTNKGRFTAPIAGFYFFNAKIEASTNGTGIMGLAFSINGAVAPPALTGQFVDTTAFASTVDNAVVGSGLLQLAAGDYVEVQIYGNSAYALTVGGQTFSYFQGFLVSTT